MSYGTSPEDGMPSFKKRTGRDRICRLESAPSGAESGQRPRVDSREPKQADVTIKEKN